MKDCSAMPEVGKGISEIQTVVHTELSIISLNPAGCCQSWTYHRRK